MYFKFFTKEELARLWVDVEEQFKPDPKSWVDKFDTLLINKIDIKDIIDESNITFTYNSLDKTTKEAIRTQIMNNLQYILQYAWNKIDMDQFALLIAWLDFDPLKLFSKKEKKFNNPNEEVVTENPTMEEEPQSEPEMSEEDIMAQLSNIS